MSSHRDLFPSVDEKKALEQLEKFQREIQSARWKREQATAEFETFVKGFADPPGSGEPPGSEADQHPRAAPATPTVGRAMRRHDLTTPLPRATQQPIPAPPVLRPPESGAQPQPPAPEPQTISPETASYSSRLQHWRGIALIGAALVAIVLLAIGWWQNAPPSSTRDGQATPAPATSGTAGGANASVASTPPAAERASAAQPAVTLTATRRVWVRVMADGHRLFERELAAGQSVPLDATQAIVVRAGDAGAVRLTFADGRDEMLGAEGQVVTRRFELRTRN